MLVDTPIDRILFIDIETVPAVSEFSDLDDKFRALWEKKADHLIKDDEHTAESIYSRAGIYAEFGKIVCISAGFVSNDQLRIKSFADKDEKKLLVEFSEMLVKHFNTNSHYLCAHNGKEFDFPYICRRMLINGLSLPSILMIAGKKPWEIRHYDTLELWKFGDYKSYTSLELLATLFGIPTPKDDIDGSKVGEVFWKDDDLDRIVTYCQKDVVTIVQLFLRYNGAEMIQEENIINV